MPKNLGTVFVTMGVVLLVLALLLFLFNEYEGYRAGQEAEHLLDDIQSVILEETISEEAPLEEVPKEENTEVDKEIEEIPSEEMPVVMLDGYEYIGILSIPDLELNLPVMADWDYDRLKIAPCRQFGSSRTDDLVIAAHNYKTHFAYLSTLQEGAEVTFTDMEGIENHYSVKKLTWLAPEEVEKVQNSDYDLVLYSCNTSMTSRIVAFCDRVPGDIRGEADE